MARGEKGESERPGNKARSDVASASASAGGAGAASSEATISAEAFAKVCFPSFMAVSPLW